MDQKNTIVKCKVHPNCLFNYNGVCDNYVINIGTDGKCEGYVETVSEKEMHNGAIEEYKTINATCGDCEYFGNIDNCPVYKRTHVLFGMDPICLDFKAKRGQRAKCDFIDDGVDQEIVNEVCKPIDIKPSTAETNQWKAEYDCYTCLHNDHGECEFKVRPIITPQGRCCRYEV